MWATNKQKQRDIYSIARAKALTAGTIRVQSSPESILITLHQQPEEVGKDRSDTGQRGQ